MTTEADEPFVGSFLEQGQVAYQVKAGGFKPWQPSEIKEELFGSKPVKPENLAESVKRCMEVGGSYVLICTGSDPVETQRTQAVKNIADYLKAAGYGTSLRRT